MSFSRVYIRSLHRIAAIFAVTAIFVWPLRSASSPEPILVPDKKGCAIADRQAFQNPSQVQLTGWIGTRVKANEANRLVKIDHDRLLEGYRKRPGRQSWDGEHVGKWLHAATLAWVNTGDPALRQKLDLVVRELIKCQLPDGYLGTYLEKDRWTEWDVWAHKYNLIGLLTYMRHTGNREPLAACLAMADLLVKTFGEAPGQRDIIKAGHHVGMAPTSVLEAMVLLHRFTGETRYLDFCQYLLRAWEQPNGPKIVSTLRTAKRVDKVGNGKAYEMLSCLNGALEYYRTVGGHPEILEACLNAWQDIVDKRLYITGAASYREHFYDDFDLPNVNNVGETCVTVTWLQFNAQLLRLTGEARFAEQLERVVVNQLFGAQSADGSAWGYYVQMEGRKPYSDTLDGHCCLSSGPRGVALIPSFAVSTDAEGVVINLYDAGTAKVNLQDGTPVSLVCETRYPAEGRIQLKVSPAAEKTFAVKMRLPLWCQGAEARVNGQPATLDAGADGYAAIKRRWKAGDQIELHLPLAARVVIGAHANKGKVALMFGPLVLAADEALLPQSMTNLTAVSLAGPDISALGVLPQPALEPFKTWPGAQWYVTHVTPRKNTSPPGARASAEARLLPFADAGGTRSRYKVWLPLVNSPSLNVLLDGTESRSRQGNQSGSLNDEDQQSMVVTFDGQPAREDWFAVTLDVPASIQRVVFMHGKVFHDGGWFDASAGKPKVQVLKEAGGAWETVGELRTYPATTATKNAKIKNGQPFTLELPAPIKVTGVRVLGVPACGDNPKQAFASGAELQAFGP